MPAVASPIPASERRFTIEARDGVVVLVRVHARRPRSELVILDRFEPATADPQATRDGLAAVARSCADACGRSGEVLVLEKPESAPVAEALTTGGFVVARRKVSVGRPLTGMLPDPGGGWILRTLAETPEPEFVDRMIRASAGDPFEEHAGVERDPAREWRDLVAGAEPWFDPARWLLADDAHGPVGVVLPQLRRADVGTLFYVGVLPNRRREDRGRALHALGLARLATMGVTRYVGSTDVRNVAMRRVFEANGCAIEGTESYFALAPA